MGRKDITCLCNIVSDHSDRRSGCNIVSDHSDRRSRGNIVSDDSDRRSGCDIVSDDSDRAAGQAGEAGSSERTGLQEDDIVLFSDTNTGGSETAAVFYRLNGDQTYLQGLNQERVTTPIKRDQKPYFTFGLIADIQYADKADGLSGWKTMRYYRQSRLHLLKAIEEWNNEEMLPTFVFQLGDIIDGSNNRLHTSEQSLQVVLEAMEKLQAPVHHIWGNHEFYNFDRDYLRTSKLNTKWMEDKRHDGPNASGAESANSMDFYAYHFSPFSAFRCIVLDTYDLSAISRHRTHPNHVEGEDLSKFRLTKTHEKHFTEFNGGLSADQLSWLHDVLTFSDEHNEKVIIVGHVPIHPKAKLSLCLAWNYRDILAVIQSHACVVCYIAGHDHSGGYYQDSHGIHHITMEGVIESPPGANAFGTVYVYEDRMVLNGRGRVKCRVLPYRKRLEEKHQ
ncbi:manganese-dependent ADP-ribose/CDP-alcohol diphosphatase [Rhinophrynus dorsalis]